MRNVRWISEDIWACLKHAPSLRLPLSQLKCWLCGDERPEILDVVLDLPIKKVDKDSDLFSKLNFCEWGDCLELSRPKSKYCSRDCSNKNARKRYADRKKVEK